MQNGIVFFSRQRNNRAKLKSYRGDCMENAVTSRWSLYVNIVIDFVLQNYNVYFCNFSEPHNGTWIDRLFKTVAFSCTAVCYTCNLFNVFIYKKKKMHSALFIAILSQVSKNYSH